MQRAREDTEWYNISVFAATLAKKHLFDHRAGGLEMIRGLPDECSDDVSSCVIALEKSFFSWPTPYYLFIRFSDRGSISHADVMQAFKQRFSRC